MSDLSLSIKCLFPRVFLTKQVVLNALLWLLSGTVCAVENQVYEAQNKSFSLLQKSKARVTYQIEDRYYRYTGDVLKISNGLIQKFSEFSDANHSIVNAMTVDYGVRDNVNMSIQMPVVSKYHSQKDLYVSSMGDLSLGVKWEPFPSQPGVPITTLYAEWVVDTGRSPYELDVENDLSSGQGYSSWVIGLAAFQDQRKVTFSGDAALKLNESVNGLRQYRNGVALQQVKPGNELVISGSLGYRLSSEITLGGSIHFEYQAETQYIFSNDVISPPMEDRLNGELRFLISLRTEFQRILKVYLGLGLTPTSPDVLLGVMVPIELAGIFE